LMIILFAVRAVSMVSRNDRKRQELS
jgi:hypothetical protein